MFRTKLLIHIVHFQNIFELSEEVVQQQLYKKMNEIQVWIACYERSEAHCPFVIFCFKIVNKIKFN